MRLASTRPCAARLAPWLFAPSLLAVLASPLHAQSPQTSERPARASSAHADRVVLVPTAETQPEGTLWLTGYEIVVPSVGYAVSDAVQISATGVTDFSETVLADVSLKGNLLRGDLLQFAAIASLAYARGEEDDWPFGRATLVAQLCLSEGCLSSVNAAATLVAHDAPDTILPLGVGLGFVAHASRHLDILLEYASILDVGASVELIDLPVYVVDYGVRVRRSENWALDVTLVRPMRADRELRSNAPGVFRLLGVPLLVFSYRFGA